MDYSLLAASGRKWGSQSRTSGMQTHSVRVDSLAGAREHPLTQYFAQFPKYMQVSHSLTKFETSGYPEPLFFDTTPMQVLTGSHFTTVDLHSDRQK